MIKIDIHLDFETIPPQMNDAEMASFKENIKVPGNIKKPETIAKFIDENWEEKYRDLAKDTGRADIATLAWNFTTDPEKTTCLINDNRSNKAIINTFYDTLKDKVLRISKEEGIEINKEDLKNDEFMNYVKINWYGVNLRNFDLDLLWKLCIKNKLFSLANLVPRKKFDERVIDFVEVYNGPATHKYTSQLEIANFLGIQGKPGDIDGSKVYDYWMQGRYDEIAEYNIFDVNTIIEFRKAFNLL